MVSFPDAFKAIILIEISNLAEEIGFYRGHSYEKNVVERSYFGLVKHINRVLKVRIWHGVVEEGIVKWVRCFCLLWLGKF